MGGINIHHVKVDEVVLLGEHKGHTLIILGTTGDGDEAWKAGCGLAEMLYEDTDTEVVIVDVLHASVRPAKLRRIESSDRPG